MAETSNIEWCDSTFNPWMGCTKISPACDHCYAEALMDTRLNRVKWGGTRQRTRTWHEPFRWQRQADAFFAEYGRRRRVFCASLADVFDNQVPEYWRADLWAMIQDTPDLDWLLLTKRPQNIGKMLPAFWDQVKGHVWLGTTVEDQKRADQNIPHLLQHDAAVRFVSCEPLLGPVHLAIHMPFGMDMSYGINWVIAGGESGVNARPSHPDWFRLLREQCDNCGVPFLFKQWGEWAPEDCGVGFATLEQAADVYWDGQEFHFDLADQDAATFELADALYRVGKKRAGRLLDGAEHNDFPELHRA